MLAAAIAGVRKVGRTGSKVLPPAESGERDRRCGRADGEAMMSEGSDGHPSTEAVDVLAKRAAEGVPPGDSERWMSGGGIPQ